MTISLRNVGKTLRDQERKTEVFRDLSAEFPARRATGILALPGSGKTTLMRMIGGMVHPDSGGITRSGRVSLLIGSAAYINRIMSGREIIVFLARMYGIDDRPIIDFVTTFGELGSAINRPIGELSRNHKSQYLLTVSYAFPADFYAADETIVGGAGRFRQRCADLVNERRRTAGLVFTTSSPRLMELFADTGAVLHEGQLEFFPTVAAAVKRFRRLKIAAARAEPGAPGADIDADAEELEGLDA